jgi:hypothetical protein
MNAAWGLVSFKLGNPLSLFGYSLTTPAQRVGYIAICLAIAAGGLSYMGWRQDWRYGLSGLVSITAWLCMVFGGLLALPLISPAHVPIMILGLSVSQILFALAWACCRKGRQNNKGV